MPYNPGVVDISGQLRAQGVRQAAQSIGQGFQDVSANIANYMDEVKTAKAKNKALEDMLKQYSQEFGFKTPEALDAFLADNPRENAMQRQARLGTHIQGMMTKNSLEQAKQQMEHQKLLGQQAQQRAAQEQKDQEALGRMLGAIRSGAVGGEGGTVTPHQLLPFLEGISPQGIDKVDQVLRVFGPQKQKALEPTTPVPTYNPKTGKTELVTYDKGTGDVIAVGEAPRTYESPEEGSRRASLTAQMQEEAKAASDHLNSIRTSSETADRSLASINKVRDLYSRGATSGAGQEYITSATAYLTRAGLWDKGRQATQEALQAELSKDALNKTIEFLRGQGSVTEAERTRIDAVAASVNKTPGANEELMKMAEAVAIKAKEAEKFRRTLKKKGLSSVEISEELRNWSADNPFETFMPKSALEIYNSAVGGRK